MVDAVDAYLTRVAAVVAARLRGPKARKGTRHWTPAQKHSPAGRETKALDTEHVVPDSLIAEIIDTTRPVALRVARDAAADAATRAGADVPDVSANADGMFAVDEELLADLVDEVLEDLLGDAARYAEGLRKAILTGEDDGLDIDGLLDRVEQAATRGGKWLRLNARTIGTALAGKAALEQARALGVTYTQWISRRDGNVRKSHVIADGQVRLVGEKFKVGRHRLEYPGDPSGLPGTAEEVHNCRCSLLLGESGGDDAAALTTISAAAEDGPGAAGVVGMLAAAVAAREFVGGPTGIPALPALAAAVTTPVDVVGWRVMSLALSVVPGQQLELPAGTVLGLAPPSEPDATTLAVLVPAGTPVGVTGGALVLPAPATVLVLTAGEAGVWGRIADPSAQ